MKNYTRVYSIFFILSFMSAIQLQASPVNPPPSVFRMDEIEYFLYGFDKKKSISEAELSDFHSQFLHSAREIYANAGIKTPMRYRIAIAENSNVFHNLSGLPRYVSAVHSSASETYIFMHPRTLRHKGILENTIKHEVCHAMIHDKIGYERAKIQIVANTSIRNVTNHSDAPSQLSDNLWMEESLCESRFPVSSNSDTAGIMVLPPKFTQFREQLQKRISRGHGKSRREGYKTAGMWGEFLISAWGENSIIAYISTGKDEDKLVEYYSQFLLRNR